MEILVAPQPTRYATSQDVHAALVRFRQFCSDELKSIRNTCLDKDYECSATNPVNLVIAPVCDAETWSRTPICAQARVYHELREFRRLWDHLVAELEAGWDAPETMSSRLGLVQNVGLRILADAATSPEELEAKDIAKATAFAEHRRRAAEERTKILGSPRLLYFERLREERDASQFGDDDVI